MSYAFEVPTDGKVKLKDFDPAYDGGLTKDDAKKRAEKLGEELDILQQELYAASQHAVLLVLQGLDASGKDGTIRYLLSAINPHGCRVESFKQPSDEESAHDFLWRIHKVVPPKGIVGVFNRSHYEDIIAVRIRGLAPASVWKGRYERINEFEALLAANNTIVLKCFLHISKDEQKERLLERERDPLKVWKLSAEDWRDRERWSEYQEAYEDVLNKCSAPHAPWYIVPADKKWYRNLAIAELLRDKLKTHSAKWRERLEEISKERLAEVAAVRNK